MKNIKKAKEAYDSIKIPNNLSKIVDQTINREYIGKKDKISKKSKIAGIALSTCLATCFLFVVLVNENETFAKSVSKIPVIKELAKLVTIEKIVEEDNEKLVYANIPAIQNTGNTDLEKRINYEISKKMDEVLKEAEKRASEYKQAVLDTGGSLEDYHPILINIDYELKYSGSDLVSFVINKSETLASAYTEQYIYNIDIETGKELNLKDVLGEDYKEIVDNEINRQIEERKKDKENSYFTPEEGGFDGIENEYQNFYINENRKVVIVFFKYEIAPGYMGMQEFEISNYDINI